jgi:hypothetical protein
VLGVEHRLGHALLKEAELGALRDGVADGELDHVVGARQQREHVVEDARPLHVGAVFKEELLCLKVLLFPGPRDEGDARFVLREGQVGEDVLLLLLGKVPEDYHAVRVDEYLAKGLRVGD